MAPIGRVIVIVSIIDNFIDKRTGVSLCEGMASLAVRAGLGEATQDVGSGERRRASDVVQAVMHQLEEDIALGYLQPRERLIEDALIAQFAIKRHVVREVLAELERMGLVERQPNRGASVRDLKPDEVEEIYAVREILETAAAREAARRATPDAVDALARVQHLHDRAALDGDPRAALRANIEFHRAFFALCGNRHLAEAIELHGQKAHGVRSFSITRPDYLERARDEHWAMIRALRDGEEEKLVALCRDHIRDAMTAYIAAYRLRFPEQSPTAPRDLRGQSGRR